MGRKSGLKFVQVEEMMRNASIFLVNDIYTFSKRQVSQTSYLCSGI